MEQVEITEITKLLDKSGSLVKPGFCKNNLYVYKRDAIKANPLRIKEWDFYQLSNQRYTMQMTVADISIGGGGCFTLIDRLTGERVDKLNMSPLTMGRIGLPENTEKPHIIKNKGVCFNLQICVQKQMRCIKFKGFGLKGEPIEVDIKAGVPDGLESLVMAVPFKEKGHFYLNQKINSMPAEGYIQAGTKRAEFNPQRDFLILDWGRGVWPYKCSWYWGNGSTRLPDGSVFGFEIGWGFGDMSAATENMLFYNGKGHKICHVYLKKDDKDWMKPWHFTSDDGRFEMTMTPEYDNYTSSRVLGLVGNRCHQVFGKWNGTAVLDDGTKLNIKDMLAFCEFSDNRW